MRLVARDTSPGYLTLVALAVALLASFALSSIAIALGGVSPLVAYKEIAIGALGSRFAITETFLRAIPLMFTGLAAAVAFRAKLWNIGAEGQFYLGALIVVVLGTGLIDVPGFILIPVLLVAAFAIGALLLLGPTIMKSALGVDEVVTTLLLNFIVLLFISMLLDGPLKDPMAAGWPRSKPILEQGELPQLIARTRLHAGLLIAIVAAIVIQIINTRTIWGFEMNAVGANPEASRFLGLPVTPTFIRVAVLSGGLAGLGGAVEVMGVRGDLTNDISPGFGYSGIVVATLAALNPLAAIPAAIFVAGIFVGADAMSREVGLSSFIAQVITAISLLCMLCAMLIKRYRIGR